MGKTVVTASAVPPGRAVSVASARAVVRVAAPTVAVTAMVFVINQAILIVSAALEVSLV